MSLRIGYVVKRFPRESETFIAQEILELERQGAQVDVLMLWPNDRPAQHAWLSEIAAPQIDCSSISLSDTWKWLHRQTHAQAKADPEKALAQAFRYPDRRGRHRLREAVAVAKVAIAHQLDHLHAHFANDPAFVAYLAHLASGTSFSFTAHAKDIYAKTLPRDLFEDVVRASAFLATVSENNLQFLESSLPINLHNRIRRVYNGVDLDRLSPPAAREPKRPLSITCVARLIEKKGVDILLSALEHCASAGLDFSCQIVGDGENRERLEAKAEAQGIRDRITFTGWLAQEGVVEILQQSDLFVLPARVANDGDRDALPTVLLEAMACGVACISTPIGGIPEIIDNGRSGLIVPSEQPLALSEAIRGLHHRNEQRTGMAEAGRQRVESMFDRTKNVAELHRLFRESSALSEPTHARKFKVIRS